MNWEYFCPGGFWGGYKRFFDPCIPSRIGDMFISSVTAAFRGNELARQNAIKILESTFFKTVSHIKGVKPFEVECFPTEEAKVAIQMLSPEHQKQNT
jgi:cytochrome c556